MINNLLISTKRLIVILSLTLIGLMLSLEMMACSIFKDNSVDENNSYEQPTSNPCFVVDTVETESVQSDVMVRITLKNNPGISSIALNVIFDTSLLTLTDIEYNSDVIGGQTVPYNSATSSVKLIWVNWKMNVDEDCVFATLFFSVSDIASGHIPITIIYDADDVYDVKENNIHFDIVNGAIIVN